MTKAHPSTSKDGTGAVLQHHQGAPEIQSFPLRSVPTTRPRSRDRTSRASRTSTRQPYPAHEVTSGFHMRHRSSASMKPGSELICVAHREMKRRRPAPVKQRACNRRGCYHSHSG